jgi:hypothetical protein
VPPHVLFTIPPVSIYNKKTLSNHRYRRTYAPVIHSIDSASIPKLVCFDDASTTSAPGEAIQYSYEVPPPNGQVVAVEIIQSNHKDSQDDYDVLVTYSTGVVECHSPNLSSVRWNLDTKHLIPFPSPSDQEVHSVFLTPLKNSAKGFLKARDDISAMLGLTLEVDSNWLRYSQLMFVLMRHKKPSGGLEKCLFLFAVHSTSRLMTVHRSYLQYLTMWTFYPNQMNPTHGNEAYYDLQITQGRLLEHEGDALVSYDLNTPVPIKSGSIPFALQPFKAFASLDSSLVFTDTEKQSAIYDLKYWSLYASANRSECAPSKKRKLDAFGGKTSCSRPIVYLKNSANLIALKGNDIVSFQLHDILPVSVKISGNSRLIDAVGRGVQSKLPVYNTRISNEQFLSSYVVEDFGYSLESWRERMEKLETCRKTNDIIGYERIFAEWIGLERDTSEYDAWLAQQQLVDATPEDEHKKGAPIPKWKFPEYLDISNRLQNQPKAIYALSSIFIISDENERYKSSESSPKSLSIRFLPPNVFQYILRLGILSIKTLRQAFKWQGVNGLAEINLNEENLIRAITNNDPSMRLLFYVLNSPIYLGLPELTETVKVLVGSLDSTSSHNIVSGFLSNEDLPDAPEEEASELQDQFDAANKAIERVFDTLEYGGLIRSQALRLALTRLHAYPAALITQAFHSKLSQHELIFLLQLLRIELANGGWLTRYFDQNELTYVADTDDDPSDRGIIIITSLLSCVLDAIGIGGWLNAAAHSPSSSDENPSGLLHLLREEVSAALECLHEATYMEGLLTDYLRYSQRAAGRHYKPNAYKLMQKQKPITVEEDMVAMEKRILPLGLQVEQGVNTWKVEFDGKKVRKSAREIGMDISKKVPRYGMERIMI